MSDIAIRVENLGKMYRIGQAQQRHDTLRDALVATFKRLHVPTFKRSNVPTSERSNGSEDIIWALKDVSFEVKRGEVVGIIGRNGAGKSTLLKILSRITEPTTGRVEMYGRVGSLLEVGTGFHPELTGRENIYLSGAILGMKKAEIDRRFDEIVAFAEIERFLDTPVKRYSSGMYVRLAFAVAAHLEPEILLVDEVLAVGDATFQKKCLGKMGDVGREGRTVLFVSHNMAAVQLLCEKAILLDRGIVAQAGPTRETVNMYFSRSGKLSNQIEFENSPLRRASITQKEDTIHLVVKYQLDQELDFPCLGFVISDYLGSPICGCNPRLSGISERIAPRRSGTVRMIMQYPKLLNGVYRLSLWFGDGKQDFFKAEDCLTFEIVNMVGTKQVSAKSIGPVLPECLWTFD